ncbi:2-dehydro-3-deoxygalactonokinase [Pseudoduganella eburnea]|uniref:2-dehydro-3-deoxygalactonokinase n=1 Tax=Massilia eburnea TaxID=1776165 RepID=A0A6L6QG98_9BURK|nr:2-dehydro-3-deoxygalactonokinase [Massilia eburnea]MTW11140.1 2-dehydro-3-deoxygalactonokinase [Massilia eburnea]
MVDTACLLGIDWGTSNRRAYVISAGGQCLHKHEDAQGALAVDGHFPESLRALRELLGVDALVPVVMSGMVGSAMGWQEVAYLDSSVALGRLPETLVPVSGAPGCYIVPGYCHRSHGGVDVMRGEETQLLGAVALQHGDGWYVLPGTHSKWVELNSGVIQCLSTYITGELFAALRRGGTLAPLMDGGEDDAALREGAGRALDGEALSHTLFEARARVVAGDAPASATRSYVSGLLIGTEFAARREGSEGEMPALHLLAAEGLETPYLQVAQMLGYSTHLINPDQAYCAALARFVEVL